MLHPPEHRSQSHRGNNDRRRSCPKGGPAPVFFVVMFLVCVHMIVTNVRYSLQTIPDELNPYANHLESFAVKPPDLSHAKGLKTAPHNKKSEKDDKIPAIKVPSATKLKDEGNSSDESMTKTPTNTTKKKDTAGGPPNSDSKISKQNTNKTVTLNAPNISLPAQVSPLPTLLSTMPNDNNTAITLIAMGGLGDTFLAERCIRSIRERGSFHGPIILFTDSDGYKRFQETIPFMDNRTTIIEGREEDLHPREEAKDDQAKNQTRPLKKYAQRTMIFKRFKTHHSKYIAADPNLSDSIRFVVYIDVDNIIGSPMNIIFRDYANLVADRYPLAMDFHRNFTSNAMNSTGKLAFENNASEEYGFGFVSMFRDRHLQSKMHSGIIFFDRAFETQCTNGWRNEMDTFWDSSDQTMFLRVLGDYERYRCTVFDLPKGHMNFATKRIMKDAMEERQGKRPKRYKSLQFPTFVHVTKFRVKQLNNATIHNEFVRHILKLKGNESITDNISWEDAISPSASRNITNK